MPTATKERNDTWQYLVSAATQVFGKTLPSRHKGVLSEWFATHREGVTNEVIDHAADQTALYTGGDSLAYMCKVMENKIANPNGSGKGRANGKHATAVDANVPPEGYAWDKDERGCWLHLGRDPATGKYPYGADNAADVKRIHDERWQQYQKSRRTGAGAGAHSGAQAQQGAP